MENKGAKRKSRDRMQCSYGAPVEGTTKDAARKSVTSGKYEHHGNDREAQWDTCSDGDDAVRRRTLRVVNKMKARYDRAANTDGFQAGQLALLFNPQRRKGLCPKL